MKDFKAFVIVENKQELNEFIEIAMKLKGDPIVGVEFVKHYPLTVYWNCSYHTPKTQSGWDHGCRGEDSISFSTFKEKLHITDKEVSHSDEDIESLEVFLERCRHDRISDLLETLTRYHNIGRQLPSEWVDELKDLSSRELSF